MDITIDFAKTEDIPRIMELLKVVHKVHSDARPDIFVPGTTKYSAAQVQEILTNPALPVIVARDNGVVVGYAMCKLLTPEYLRGERTHSLYIDDICVDAACRGKGVGGKLCNAAKQYAREHNCYNITLNVWELNEGAKKFYQRMGLVPLRTTLECIL